MTAFYMFRLMGKTFYGGPRRPAKRIWDRIHESTWTMTLPLVLLAIPSALLGMALGLPFGDSTLKHWLEPVFAESEELLAPRGASPSSWPASTARSSWSASPRPPWASSSRSGSSASSGGRGSPARVASLTGANGASRFLYRASLNKWWFDDLNHLLFIVIGGRVAGGHLVVRPDRRRRHGERRRPPSPSTPAAASAGSRPGASRTTRWASRSG